MFNYIILEQNDRKKCRWCKMQGAAEDNWSDNTDKTAGVAYRNRK